jgi:hypothetical protein
MPQFTPTPGVETPRCGVMGTSAFPEVGVFPLKRRASQGQPGVQIWNWYGY